MKRALFILLYLCVLVGCTGKRSADNVLMQRQFPSPEIPAVITDKQERADYITKHFWDGFFKGEGPTDTSGVLGVSNEEIEKNMSLFIAYLDFLPMKTAQERVRNLFNLIETTHTRDTSAHVYQLMTALSSLYLYDPNSPLRSEDLYLPFVEGMAKSQYSSEISRLGYEFQVEKCRLNQYGQKAPDFKFKDINGQMHTLYEVKSRYTILFFSNPGCSNCRDIIETIRMRDDLTARIASGSLAVVNIYIDEELDKWRDYVPNYPQEWINAYDPYGVIRDDTLYFVRAIPSLYLLDVDKRILLKDAPIERILAKIEH